MKINTLTVMKLFVLYFNHSEKIDEKIKYYEENGKSIIKNFYFTYIEHYRGCDWFILNIRTGQGIVMYKSSIKLIGFNSPKELIRFIRCFRNAFIGVNIKGDRL